MVDWLGQLHPGIISSLIFCSAWIIQRLFSMVSDLLKDKQTESKNSISAIVELTNSVIELKTQVMQLNKQILELVERITYLERKRK